MPRDRTLQNILLVQNDIVDASAVRDALVNSGDSAFQVIWFRHCRDALDCLAGKKRQGRSAERVAAVLVDLYLPDSSGVVAEGVETREQLVFLQDHDCPFGQGYYFSEALAARECTQLLRHGIAVNSLQRQPTLTPFMRE